jgi:hypothetical protein
MKPSLVPPKVMISVHLNPLGGSRGSYAFEALFTYVFSCHVDLGAGKIPLPPTEAIGPICQQIVFLRLCFIYLSNASLRFAASMNGLHVFVLSIALSDCDFSISQTRP